MADNPFGQSSNAVMTPERAAAILQDSQQRTQAQVLDQSSNKPADIQVITFDLSSEKLIGDPARVGFPFRTIFIAQATDATVQLNFRPNTQDSLQGDVPMGLKDVFEHDSQLAGGYFTWPAQPGKTATVVFFVNSSFKSGAQISQLQGGLAIQEGSTVSTSVVTTTAAAAGVICAALGTRKVATVQNKSGGSIWVGPSGVTATGGTMGIEIRNGESLQWKNTAQLYAYAEAAGPVVVMEEA